MLFHQTPLTYLSFILVGIAAYVLYRTPLGLAVRTVGENPAAVEAQGIDVTLLRIGAVMVGSAIMAIGGAFLTMSAFNAFFFEMVNGRGWICIALVVFGSWRPGKALLGALLFALFDAYQLRLQQLAGQYVPYQLFLMLPFVLSILALIVDVAPRRLSAGADGALPEGGEVMDLIIRGGNLPDGRTGIDIGIKDGRIAAVEPRLAAKGAREIDARGGWSRRPSSIPISTWMRRCRSACRG